MRAGLLKEVISIEQPVVDTDGYGANDKDWTEVINTRAQVTYNSGNRANENNEIVFNTEVNFTVRVYHQITEKMRIIWKNKKYRILYIEVNPEKQSQTIRTELINE